MENIAIEEKELIYLKILNEGREKLFASVFVITGIGSIYWISFGCPSGAELHERGRNPYFAMEGNVSVDEDIRGFDFDWPLTIPRDETMEESFLIIITNQKVDLGFLATSYKTEELQREIRDELFKRTQQQPERLRFGVKRIDYRLKPQS